MAPVEGSFEDHLTNAVEGLGVPPHEIALLAAHWRLVLRWNPKVNLSAITDDREAAQLHYLDSLQVLEQLKPGSVLDVGSGAGFPGIPVAVCWRHPVALLEPRRKRATFLRQVKSRLNLDYLTVIEGRSTDQPRGLFDNIVTRATFSDLTELMACRRWLAPGGRIIAMRSESSGHSPDRVVHYEVLGRTRQLEIWEA